MNTVMDGHPVGRFRLYMRNGNQVYEFFTLLGAQQFLRNYREETGDKVDYYSIFDKLTGEYVEVQSGRTE